jgi:glycosyltransferase involved in cell wall biosynthesis
VVLATFNRADLISRAIESMLAQTLASWELLIIDDESSDQTVKAVWPYLRDRRIQYLRHANRGCGQSRNVGIRLATGRFLTFLDSDDAYRSTHLAIRRGFMMTHPEVALIQGGFEVVGDPFVADYDRPGQLRSLYDCVVGATFFARRELFVEMGGFSAAKQFEDTEFWRAASLRYPAASVDLPPTYLYYRQPDSLTADWLRERAQTSTTG